jgi:hypothetical protein
MDMQDKEFDKLFSSKLNDLEIEPSKAVWQSIDQELGGKRRKAIVPFLSIAASIIILIGAGVVFYPKNNRVVKPQVKAQLVRIQPVKNAPVVSIVKQQTIVQATKAVLASVNKTVRPHAVINNNTVASITQKQVIVAKNNVVVNAPAPQMLIAETSHNIIKQTVVIDSAKEIAVMPIIHHVNKPILTAAINSSPVTKPSDTTFVRKHKIHSFGDMLNVAIAAIDKRKDKVIKFQDGDDD